MYLASGWEISIPHTEVVGIIEQELVSAIPSFGFLKYRELIGTGFA